MREQFAINTYVIVVQDVVEEVSQFLDFITACQRYRVTSGQITHSKFLYTSSHTSHQITSEKLVHSSGRNTVNSKENRVQKSL